MKKIIAATIIAVSLSCLLSLIITDGQVEIKSQKVEGKWVKLTDGRIVLIQN